MIAVLEDKEVEVCTDEYILIPPGKNRMYLLSFIFLITRYCLSAEQYFKIKYSDRLHCYYENERINTCYYYYLPQYGITLHNPLSLNQI